MEFRVLGSRIAVRSGGEAMGVSAPHVRRLLGVLLLAEGRPVPAEVLGARLRDSDDADPAAELARAVDGVRRLVRDRLVVGSDGYWLRLHEDDYFDLREFRDLAARARRSRDSDPASAAADYERALELWADRPLQDLPRTVAMDPIRRSLLTERDRARDEFAALRLALPKSTEAKPPVRRMTSKDLSYRPRTVLTPLAPDRAADLRIDTNKASPARIYDYYLGGKDNYAVDREAAEAIMRTVPEAPAAARANRAFLTRAVRYLAAQAGLRQFIDVGAGLPTQGNVHEIVHDVDPDARVVYVDNDPVVLVHGRALLEGSRDVAVIGGDLRRPEEIMADPRLNELIDFGAPVGLLLVAILHFIPDDEHPDDLVARLVGRLPPGSHVVVSHGYEGGMDPDAVQHAMGVRRQTVAPICSRSPARLAKLLAGLEILDPGVVWIPEWGRPQPAAHTVDPQLSHFIGAVARKP